MSTIHFVFSHETFVVNQHNQFTRPKLISEYGSGIGPGSDNWKLLGAVEYKFGRIVRRYSVEDIRDKKVPWHYKNGKQRCFPLQYDYGSHSIMMMPKLLYVTVF
jgi:hypothetical protein